MGLAHLTEQDYPKTHNLSATAAPTVNNDVVDATDMHNMFLTALNAKKGHLDSGTTLKNSVRAAVDKAGVDAVIDNR